MAREDPQFRIRLPAELKAQVEEAARRGGRSLNAEIVRRLQAAITWPDEELSVDVKMIQEIRQSISKDGDINGFLEVAAQTWENLAESKKLRQQAENLLAHIDVVRADLKASEFVTGNPPHPSKPKPG